MWYYHINRRDRFWNKRTTFGDLEIKEDLSVFNLCQELASNDFIDGKFLFLI